MFGDIVQLRTSQLNSGEMQALWTRLLEIMKQINMD